MYQCQGKMVKPNTVKKKPYQWVAWCGTVGLIVASILASFVPELYLHHYFFVVSNTIWAITGLLWKENTLVVLNAGLTVIYILGVIV